MTPTRPPYLTSHRLSSLQANLTPEDARVLEDLQKVRVATGLQLQRLHHGTGDAAKQRRVRQLSRMSRMRLITRLARRVGGVTGGSVSSVYALDLAGLRLLDTSGRPRRPWTPSTPFVAHAVAVTELYVQLVEAARIGRIELLGFDAEPRCWRHYTDGRLEPATLKPDADVTLAVGDFEHHWFIEVDLGTESAPRVVAKARQYLDFYGTGDELQSRGVVPRVLWVVPDERRRLQVTDALARACDAPQDLFSVALADQAFEVLVAEDEDRGGVR